MRNQPNVESTSQPADDGTSGSFYRRRLPHWQPAEGTIFLTWRLYGSLPEEAVQRLVDERRLLQKRLERSGEPPRDRALRHSKRLFALADDMLAVAETGPRWLQDERIAQLVVDALFHYHLKRYVLLAFVVMPNHVHVLLRPLQERQARKPAPLENRQAGTRSTPEDGQAGKPAPLEDRQAGTRSTPEDGQAGKPAPQYVPLRKITQSLKGYTAREANRILERTGLPFWQDESYDHSARDEAEMQRIVDYIESDPVRAGLVNHSQDWHCSSAWERECGRMMTGVKV